MLTCVDRLDTRARLGVRLSQPLARIKRTQVWHNIFATLILDHGQQVHDRPFHRRSTAGEVSLGEDIRSPGMHPSNHTFKR